MDEVSIFKLARSELCFRGGVGRLARVGSLDRKMEKELGEMGEKRGWEGAEVERRAAEDTEVKVALDSSAAGARLAGEGREAVRLGVCWCAETSVEPS